MPRATCRCGYPLSLPDGGSDRIVCPGCGSRVRVRRRAPDDITRLATDGYIRFTCLCGRRLKVDAFNPPSHGKCPDCDRVVPVPAAAQASLPSSHPESLTEEMTATDYEALERWKRDLESRSGKASSPAPATVSDRAEVGLRICPRCRKPIHLGANACRECGTPVPRK